MSVERPPSDIAPRDFFTTWLPRRFSERFDAASSSGVAGMTLRVRLEGDGGGSWDLSVDEGQLRVEEDVAGETAVTLTQSVDDWRAAVTKEHGMVSGHGGLPRRLPVIDAQLRQMLAPIRGAIGFEITRPSSGEAAWSIVLKLGDQPAPARPDALVSVDAATLREINAGRLQPTDAYFSGLIRITGNAALPMQLAMTVLPRLKR